MVSDRQNVLASSATELRGLISEPLILSTYASFSITVIVTRQRVFGLFIEIPSYSMLAKLCWQL